MSVDNSALHPKTGPVLDPTPLQASANPADEEVAGDRDRVVAAFLHLADQHPGGLTGVLEQFRNNGLGGHLSQWAQGNAQAISPEGVQQGLGEDLLLIIAGGANVSQLVARTVLSAALPKVILNVAPGGKPAAPQVGNLRSQVLQALS